MVDYIKGVLEDLPEFRMGRHTILADNNLFRVRPEDYQTLLSKEWATALYHTVAQLLFFMSRARKDIKMSIDFLWTWVRIPDEDEWKNIVRVIRYTRGCEDTRFLTMGLMT